MSTSTNNRTVAILAVVVGLILLALAVIYFVTPANALPAFVPGFDPALARKHTTHGVAALVLGLAAFALAWFQSGSKKSA